ncbi:glycosyltransferase [Candidatus Uhrbacteria bacterium]|nr:glycosyltransferase [Candidatus Uhrbacteria bacterium]
MSHPRLSIVIPTLNEEKYLPHLLDSIRIQTFTDYEVIVADAFSKDRTRALATEAGARVVDGGLPSAGRNRGAAAARGEIILFLDADVILPDELFLESAVAEFEKKQLGIATALIRPLSERAIDHLMYQLYNVYAIATQKFMPHVPGFFIFVRREAHEKIGGFDETLQFAEDHEYARRASKVTKFGFLRDLRVPVSMRRFDKEGRLTIALKYLLGELYLIRQGKVPPETITYEWGYDQAVKKETALQTLWKNGKSLWEKSKKSPKDQ